MMQCAHKEDATQCPYFIEKEDLTGEPFEIYYRERGETDIASDF